MNYDTPTRLVGVLKNELNYIPDTTIPLEVNPFEDYVIVFVETYLSYGDRCFNFSEYEKWCNINISPKFIFIDQDFKVLSDYLCNSPEGQFIVLPQSENTPIIEFLEIITKIGVKEETIFQKLFKYMLLLSEK